MAAAPLPVLVALTGCASGGGLGPCVACSHSLAHTPSHPRLAGRGFEGVRMALGEASAQARLAAITKRSREEAAMKEASATEEVLRLAESRCGVLWLGRGPAWGVALGKPATSAALIAMARCLGTCLDSLLGPAALALESLLAQIVGPSSCFSAPHPPSPQVALMCEPLLPLCPRQQAQAGRQRA